MLHWRASTCQITEDRDGHRYLEQDCHKAPSVHCAHTYTYDASSTSHKRRRELFPVQLRCEGGGDLLALDGAPFEKSCRLPAGTEGVWVVTMRDASQSLLGKSFRRVRLLASAPPRNINVRAGIEYVDDVRPPWTQTFSG